jgi:hypothetical protein
MDFIGNVGSFVGMICKWGILILFNNCMLGVMVMNFVALFCH